MLKLKIPNPIFDELLEYARANVPVEACGILAGLDRTVHTFYKMTNTDKSSDHFLMDPAEQFAVVRDMRAAGLQMLAIYHSHPETPARPSEEDVRLALTPNVVYAILSLQNPDSPVLRGFLIEDGQVREIPVERIEQAPDQQTITVPVDQTGATS